MAAEAPAGTQLNHFQHASAEADVRVQLLKYLPVPSTMGVSVLTDVAVHMQLLRQLMDSQRAHSDMAMCVQLLRHRMMPNTMTACKP